MIASGLRLDEQEVAPAVHGRRTGAGGREVARRRRDVRPPWGVVNCPDGPHRVDLGVVRQVMTRLLVAGELGYDVITDLAKKAGVSRSTVSRMLRGRPTGLKTVVAVLGALQLTTEDVISKDPMPDALAAVEDIAE